VIESLTWGIGGLIVVAACAAVASGRGGKFESSYILFMSIYIVCVLLVLVLNQPFFSETKMPAIIGTLIVMPSILMWFRWRGRRMELERRQ
jgi:hypothetical protein